MATPSDMVVLDRIVECQNRVADAEDKYDHICDKFDDACDERLRKSRAYDRGFESKQSRNSKTKTREQLRNAYEDAIAREGDLKLRKHKAKNALRLCRANLREELRYCEEVASLTHVPLPGEVARMIAHLKYSERQTEKQSEGYFSKGLGHALDDFRSLSIHCMTMFDRLICTVV